MVKDVHSSTLELFERLVGPTVTELAEQKARLVRSTVEAKDLASRPVPHGLVGSSAARQTDQPCLGFQQGGARWRNAPSPPAFSEDWTGPKTVIDPGVREWHSGLGGGPAVPRRPLYTASTSRLWRSGRLEKASRQTNWGEEASFLTGDGLEDFEKESADLILCNPPFHYQNAQTLEIALALFDQARKVLRPEGELWVVANRHLGHHKSLAQRFSRVQTAALDDQFIVLRARP